jgi:putative transposase
MSKHAKKSEHLQLVDHPKTTVVEVPLPMLGAFASIEDAFFDLCIHSGRQVQGAMMEQDREELCGPRWQPDPDRTAGRVGTRASEVTLGGRRISITRPRVRNTDGKEVGLPSFDFARRRDPLDRHAVNAVACGVSTRKCARSLEPLPKDVKERSTSKSAVSLRYVAMTTKQMTAWLTTPLNDRHFPIVMIDRIILGDHTVMIAMGIDTDGVKQVLGVREGDTESKRVVNALLGNLIDRGLDADRARLFVIDGAKALPSAIRKTFGKLAVSQRCPVHKYRNIVSQRPDRLCASVKSILREAWDLNDSKTAKCRLESLASSLEADHPGAAASVREGLDETLTLQGLGIEGTLYKKLRSTNAIENLNSGIATYSRNVKRWQGGSMVTRWVGAAIVEAGMKFRRVQGWRDIEKLVRALNVFETEQAATAERVA